jgi:NAD(P)-dependent dehydrogenase (short-subunit alcohol dehydrogenase family)
MGLLRVLASALLVALAPRAMAAEATVLITGANRGIGLEFARQYAARDWRVIATARNPAEAKELGQLAAADPDIVIEPLELANHAQVDALAAKYRGQAIDVLINNAGVSGDFRGPGQAFGSLDWSQADLFLQSNALGAVKVTEALYENVRISRQKKIVAITALLGVHSFNYGGGTGAYWYKISKATLNAAMANIARDVRGDGVIVTLLSPGEVAVEKVGPNPPPNFIKPEVSIRGMIKVIDGLTLADSGAIIRYTGQRQPF